MSISKSGRSLRIPFAAFLMCMVATSPASAQVSPIGAHHTTVGDGAGLSPATSPTGGFAASVAMDLPASRDGIPVPLQIQYGASTRVGAAGSGWDIPLSYVRLSTTSMRRKPSVEDDGSLLNLVPPRVFVALGGSPTLMVPLDKKRYLPFASDRYMELLKVGDDWELHTLDGLDYVFSPVSSISGGELEDPGLWLLTEIRNHFSSDRVELVYGIKGVNCGTDNTPEVNLTAIRHTHDASGVPLYEVRLTYDVWPAEAEGSACKVLGQSIDEGFRTARRRIVDHVEVLARDNLAPSSELRPIRTYQLTYSPDADTALPRLTAVDVSGEPGVSGPTSLPVARYEYGSIDGIHGNDVIVPRSFIGPGGVDRSGTYASSLSSSEVKTEEFVVDWEDQLPGGPAPGFQLTATLEHIFTRHIIRDFTGDGLPDLVFKSGDTWVLYQNRTTDTGTRLDFSTPFTWTQPAEIFEQTTFQFTGVSHMLSAAREVPVTTETWVQFTDWTGDGRMDIVDARGGDEAHSWKVWVNEGLANGQVVWRPENVFIDELRPAGTDPAYPILDLQTQVNIAVGGVSTEGSMDLHANVRFPLERSRSLARVYTDQCEGRWEEPEWGSGHEVGDPVACSVPFEFVEGETDTLVEWRVTDANGDGYPDFMTNLQPVLACEQRADGSSDSGGVRWSHEEDWRFLAYGVCPHPVVGGEAPLVDERYEVFLNVGGSLFPAFAHEGEVFRSTGEQAGDRSGIGHWVNGEKDWSYGSEFEPPSWSLDPGPSVEALGYADSKGDGVPGFTRETARFESDRWDVCVSGAQADQPYYSRQVEGLVDLNGDGIPDQVSMDDDSQQWTVRYGTGAGYGPAHGLGGPGTDFELSLTEGACGGTSRTVAGLIDLDGDGIPEVLRVEGDQLWSSRIVNQNGTLALSAGRLVAVGNGYGAVTRIQYGNNKTDVSTPHQVPFPEVVVREVMVDIEGGSGAGIIPTRYAYGTAQLRYDPLLARWGFPGYQRTVALTGDPLNHGPDYPFTEGLAIITDRTGAAPAGSGHAEFVLSGRTFRTTRLEGSFGTDPRELLNVDVATDGRARAGVTIEHEVIDLPGNAEGSDGEECFDADGASGAYPLEDYALCRKAGLIVAWSTTQWEGSAAPPSTNNVLSGSYVEAYDALGRPTRTVSQGDLRRTDDDTCNFIQYAVPLDERQLTAPSAIWTSDCGWGRPENVGTNPTPGAPIIIAGVRFHYDNLPAGSVGAGRVSARIVERYDGDGILLDEFVAEQNSFNAMHLPSRVVRNRTIGAAAEQVTEFEYDRYGATITSTRATANDVDVALVRTTRYPTWPSLPVEVTNPAGEISRTYRDELGRPIRDTATPVGGPEYLQDSSRYNDDPAGRFVTTTVHLGSTLATDDAPTRTRTARTYVDSLGRARCTEEELGADYQHKTLVSRFTRYDPWGRAWFLAAPFQREPGGAPCSTVAGSPPYGTTYVYDSGGRKVRSVDGPWFQLEANQTDPALDIYPTTYQYLWRDGLSILRVQGPTEAQAGSPTAGAWDEMRVTASGRAIDSSRWRTSSVRRDLVERTYDRLGRVAATRRYKNPQNASGVVEWSQKFDSLGQLLEQREPGAAPILTRYDDWGAPLESEWLDGGNRRLTRMAYDGLGRLTERHLLTIQQGSTTEAIEGTEYFHYDTHSGDAHQPPGTGTFAGRLSWSEAVGTSAEFATYDEFGRPQTSTVVHDDEGAPFRTRTRYSASGTVDAIGYEFPGGNEEVRYSYDSAGRMRQVAYSDGTASIPLIASSEIDALGRHRALTLGNGVKETFAFHTAGRQELAAWSVQTATDLRAVTYDELDPELRIKKLGERTTPLSNPNGPFTYSTYTYDDLDRLTISSTLRQSTLIARHSYRYDGLGNHTQIRDHLDSSALLDVYYQVTDPDKLHRTHGPVFNGGSIWQFEYDGAGNVVSHWRVSGSGSLPDRYFTYDSGSRITKMMRGARTAAFTYAPGGGLLKEEVRNGGVLDREIRHYGPMFQRRTRASGPSVIERYVPGPLGIVASIRGTGSARSIVYAHGDGRANKFFTRADGTVVQSAEYHPYGKIRSQTGTPSSQDYSDDLFNGGDTYSEFGVVVLGARIYDPDLGRFLQRDPIKYVPRSTKGNPYTFSFADPINHTDASGLQPEGSSASTSSASAQDWMTFIAVALTTMLSSDFAAGDTGGASTFGARTGGQTGGAGTIRPSLVPKLASEYTAEFGIGFGESIVTLVKETAFNLFDIGGLELAVACQETGWCSYQHDPVSAVAAAHEQGASPSDLLGGMVTAPIHAVENFVGGALDGDTRKMGNNFIGVYGAWTQLRFGYAAGAAVATGVVSALSPKAPPSLPPYTGGKTSGVLRTASGDTPLVSGYAGPSANMPRGTPGMNGNIKSHVEAHAASIMRQQGIQDATLYINRVPCSGATGCGAMLPRMLPPGSVLRLIGPDGYSKTFVGTPD